MEDAIPNYGLCDFKDSIGCFASSKYILKKEGTYDECWEN